MGWGISLYLDAHSHLNWALGSFTFIVATRLSEPSSFPWDVSGL